MMITLDLNKEEIEKLEYMLWQQDTGPLGSGWSSDLLISLREKVDNAIEKLQESE